MPFFDKKKTKIFYDAKLIFWQFATFFIPTIFWSGAKQRCCFRESMWVLDQNGRIQALEFLAWWHVTSHALNYNTHYIYLYLASIETSSVVMILSECIQILILTHPNLWWSPPRTALTSQPNWILNAAKAAAVGGAIWPLSKALPLLWQLSL